MRRTIIALALVAALVAGCGGGDEEEQTPGGAKATEEPSGGGATLEVSAPKDGSLKFDQSELKAKAGKVSEATRGR